MGRKTQFLNLHLADANDVYDVEVDQNQNFEKIDKKLKELDTGKEPIINKKSGFNLDKTDEYNLDDTNKLGTARALKKLYDFLKNKIESIKLNWEGISDKPAFGLGRGEFLEGHRLAESLGVEEYGGLINQSGRKEKGKAYYDTNTKEMFLCIKSTTTTSASAEDFKPFSNKALLERLENFFKFKVINSDVIALKTVFEASFRIEECKFVIVNIDTYSNSPNLLNLSSLTIPYLFLKQGGKYCFSDFSTAYEKAEISLIGNNLIIKSINKTVIYIGEIYTI